MARVATYRDIQDLHKRIDNLGNLSNMNYEVIEQELNELRAARDVVLKMVADLTVIVQGQAEDAAKLEAIAAAIDEVSDSLEAVAAPRDTGGSTGNLPD
jgi:hypothetical protein